VLISTIHYRVPTSTLMSLSIHNTMQTGLKLTLWDVQAKHMPQTFADIWPLLTFLCLEAVCGFNLAETALTRVLPCLHMPHIEGVFICHNLHVMESSQNTYYFFFTKSTYLIIDTVD